VKPFRFAPVASGLLLLALLGSCRSTPAPVDVSSLSAPKLVQAAQGEADKGNYRLALDYYRALRDRFPDQTERVLWASYEIAFLTHKMGEDAEAIRLFDELIQDYAARNDPQLPQGPLVLARKVRENLIEDQNAAAAKKAPRKAP
jgi:outer membrane protein assembly factor BamD (BamD/ComL family)